MLPFFYSISFGFHKKLSTLRRQNPFSSGVKQHFRVFLFQKLFFGETFFSSFPTRKNICVQKSLHNLRGKADSKKKAVAVRIIPGNLCVYVNYFVQLAELIRKSHREVHSGINSKCGWWCMRHEHHDKHCIIFPVLQCIRSFYQNIEAWRPGRLQSGWICSGSCRKCCFRVEVAVNCDLMGLAVV